jgi:hypothetical protein
VGHQQALSASQRSPAPRAARPDWDALVARHHAGMAELRTIVGQDDDVSAVSRRDPSYKLLLSVGVSGDSLWRVTSFRDGQLIGHRQYDRLDGGSPVQNALQEFASSDLTIIRRRRPA